MAEAIEVTVVEAHWVPQWAKPHVHAVYTPLVYGEDGIVEEPQHIRCWCDNCSATWKQDCPSGLARNHIQKFCNEHNKCGVVK